MSVRYHAYLDESGQREFGARTDRYFVVGGVVARSGSVRSYEDELAGVKRAFFGDPNVELKSNWLRIPGERKRRYLTRYGMSDARLKRFVRAVYDWLIATDLLLMAGVIDKEQLQQQYSDPYHPSALGYQVFLQRYQNYLGSREGVGAITFDEPSGSSEAGNHWKNLLSRQHRTLKRNGCRFTKITFDDVANSIAFGDSLDHPLIQIADLFCYNTFRQFRTYGTQWDDPKARTLDLYEYFDRMLPRVRSQGRVFAGYGIAKMPRLAYNRWELPSRIP